MNRITLLAIGMSAAIATSALADKPATTEKPTMAAKTTKLATTTQPAKTEKLAKGMKPAKMTCEEFLSVEDVVKPKLVYWVEGFNRKGKPEDATFEVETTDRLVPVLIEVCKKEPKESFWKKVKDEFKKIF